MSAPYPLYEEIGELVSDVIATGEGAMYLGEDDKLQETELGARTDSLNSLAGCHQEEAHLK